MENEPRHRASNDSSRLLRAHYQIHKTMVPPKPWLLPNAPSIPQNVIRTNRDTITWDADPSVRYYAVYRAPISAGVNDLQKIIDNPMNIAARVWNNNSTLTFTDNVRNANQFNYFVTALNAAHVESQPVIAVTR
jgi:hypothetical protein